MPILAAIATVWRAWLDWVAPCVMMVSAPCLTASAIKNSSLRVLLPPVLKPVQSSRLMYRLGPPSASVMRGMNSSGVGPWVMRTRGKLVSFMGTFFLA